MIVNSGNIEFGYELISVIPYANYLANKGLLKKTISGNDTECLYFFSPEHEINPERRSWYNTNKVGTPNIAIHKNYLDKSQFMPPDYKKQYGNDRFKFEKEIVIICNRYNIEWNTEPINFFSPETLYELFSLLHNKYQVIYINIEGINALYDNAEPIHIKDREIVKQFKDVIDIRDLLQENTDISFNQLQLMLFANCEKYITMNGGHAILSSFFGGENIIMSKFGKKHAKEINPEVNSFYRWYHEFGGQRCIHVKDESELIERIKENWINNNPVVNILVRTSNRPNFFKRCIESIETQSYKNVNIIASVDNRQFDYTIPYKVYPVFVKKNENISRPENINDISYGWTCPYNIYFNEMYKLVKSGIVMYLDDDDQLNDKDAIQKIVYKYKKGNELIFWRVKIGEKIVPDINKLGKEPELFNISGIGFAFDAKYTSIAQWEPYKRGDYRIAKKLYANIDKKTSINEILTSSQDGPHYGQPVDININTIEKMENKVKVKIIHDKNKHGKLDVEIGQIIEINESLARQYYAFNIAVPYSESIKDIDKIVDEIAKDRPELVDVKPVKNSKKNNNKK